ncbi:hypothetical protein VTN77DRAFT_8213 [Rasamsonia byssochlamydoides]|uniref:uncharacterized protein n=1 Tax=Rasamsonia byssochlamydoides TaxID=89139 RepID=UPI00374485C5
MLLNVLHTLVALAAVPTIASKTSHPGRPVMFTTEDGRQVPGPDCDCYVVSGPEPGFFQHYRFWDFRSVPLDPAVAKDYNFYPSVGVHEDPHGDDDQPILLKDTPFANDWNIQDWHRNGSRLFPITIVNSNKNVFITKSYSGGASTFLALRNTRLEKYSSTAEIETSFRNFFHCSLRVRLRLLGKDEPILSPPTEQQALVEENQMMMMANPESVALVRRNARRHPPPNGACAGIFTYYSTTSESDIEILTADPPNRVHYANQPDYDPVLDRVIPGASEVKDVPVPWTSWSTHRLDWFPSISRWYVENMLQSTMTYSVPIDPSMLIINLWSDGGLWSGNLTVGESVHLGIEWIELAYNVSGSPTRREDGNDDDDGVDEAHILLHHPHGKRHQTNGHGLFNSQAFEHEDLQKRDQSKGCKVMCRIDNIKHNGIPEIVWNFSPDAVPETE